MWLNIGYYETGLRTLPKLQGDGTHCTGIAKGRM